jgi:hypothetical protein
MLSAAELTRIQSDLVAAACDKTCVIQRASNAQDSYGSPASGAYATIATTVAGMSPPTASQLQNYSAMIGTLSTWQVKLPNATDLRALDHLLIDGQTLEVNVILTPQSYSGLLTTLATEIK